MKYWIFDLEPYEERYTAQMRIWVEKAFKKRKREYEFITPIKNVFIDKKENTKNAIIDTLTTKVQNGTVLDAVGTNYYKAKQISQFMKTISSGRVKKGDYVFVFDFQYPGLEAVKYTSDLLGLDLKIYAVCHASSYVRGDFTEPMAPWMMFFEHGWWTICDGIFVGTEYHKNAIISRRDGERYKDKIHAVGNIFDTNGVREMAGELKPPSERTYDVIFSNRWDIEKNPADFVTILELLTNVPNFPNAAIPSIAITTSRKSFGNGSDKVSAGRLQAYMSMIDSIDDQTTNVFIQEDLSKEQYYKILADSKIYVSTSVEEMFGYCTVEAMALGCIPILPNCASHPELVKDSTQFLYNDLQEAADKIKEYIKHPIGLSRFESCEAYNETMNNMIDIMEEEERQINVFG